MYTLEYLSGFASKELALEAITEELGIKVKEYDSGLVVLSYNQINSPKTHPVVMECRGLILEYINSEFKVVCRPFKRFFNYGEAPDTLTDFSFNRAVVIEKSDGSFCKVYKHNGKWELATKGTAYAESENYTGSIFRGMMLGAFSLTEEAFNEVAENDLTRDCTHLYEFTSPDNRIVTPYSEPMMVYLGSVNNETGKVFDCLGALIGNARGSELYPLSSLEDCVKASAELDGLKEGFVVRDLRSGQMVKIKSPLYVKAHKIKGDYGLTPKKIIGLVVSNEQDEYLVYFPDDKEKIAPYTAEWETIQIMISDCFEENKGIEDRKEFALKVKDLLFYAVLFQAKSRNMRPDEVLLGQPEGYKVKLLTKWMEEL